MEYKYLKYKKKYLLLKNQFGGMNNEINLVNEYVGTLTELSNNIPPEIALFLPIIEKAALHKLKIPQDQYDMFKQILMFMGKTAQIIIIITNITSRSSIFKKLTTNNFKNGIDGIIEQTDLLYDNSNDVDKQLICQLLPNIIDMLNMYFCDLITNIPELSEINCVELSFDSVSEMYDEFPDDAKKLFQSEITVKEYINEFLQFFFDLKEEYANTNVKVNTIPTDNASENENDNDNDNTQNGGMLSLMKNPLAQQLAKNVVTKVAKDTGLDKKFMIEVINAFNKLMDKLNPKIVETQKNIDMIMSLTFTILYLKKKCVDNQ